MCSALVRTDVFSRFCRRGNAGTLAAALAACRRTGLECKAIDDLLFYIVLGVVLGGRLGYALFYQASFYFNHPLEIFKVWQGGMSFHGGLMGVTAAMILYARRRQR